MACGYELIGIPARDAGVRTQMLKNGRIWPLYREGYCDTPKRLGVTSPVKPVYDVMGRDWYLFQAMPGYGYLLWSWVPPEHWCDTVTITYSARTPLDVRHACIRSGLEEDYPGDRAALLMSRLAQKGILLHSLEASPILLEGASPGRRPLREMVLS